jgi:pimeloyl-ACP methyl ester carboxylesterase
VIYHHGTPSSGGLYPAYARDAAERGVRLVGFDRPGYGDSTPMPGRRIADVTADVAAIANALEFDRFACWGISGGGPHALACAALLPERVVAAATLASVAPYGVDGLDWLDGMGEGNRREVAATLEGGEAFERFLEADAAELTGTSPEQLVDALRPHLSDADAAELTGEFAEWALASFREGLRRGVDGWRDDDYAFLAPWGFELESIRVPVLLRQGRQDRMVPFGHGAWLAGRIPGVQAELSEEHGHLTLRRGIPEVHAWLLERF